MRCEGGLKSWEQHVALVNFLWYHYKHCNVQVYVVSKRFRCQKHRNTAGYSCSGRIFMEKSFNYARKMRNSRHFPQKHIKLHKKSASSFPLLISIFRALLGFIQFDTNFPSISLQCFLILFFFTIKEKREISNKSCFFIFLDILPA